MAPVWKNAIDWLHNDRKGVIGSGIDCTKTQFRKDLSVYVCTAYTDENVEEIQDFVAEGGGLLIGGHSWWCPL
uniref:Uncharacterized protein n=1 Tax=Anabas testudineus TaxID=64144 RepID=A0AAQ6IU42_ANATE